MKINFYRPAMNFSFLMLVAVVTIGALLFFAKTRHDRSKAPAGGRRDELVKSSRNQELQKFSLTGFDDQGKKFWNLEGDAAKIDPSQTIFLDQNVVLRLKEDTLIKTDHVQWSQDSGVLRTDEPVFVNHKNAIIRGIGAVGRPADSFIQLNRHIEMVINQTTRLTCEGPLKIFYKDNKMIFYRKVKITDAKGTLSSNRMDVLFDPAQKKIEKVIATGSVVIERGSDTTHSQRAIYTLATGSVRLEGSPEITLHKESSTLLDAPIRN